MIVDDPDEIDPVDDWRTRIESWLDRLPVIDE
jgi:hypothetical protein